MRKTAAFFLLGVYMLIQMASICWHYYKPLAHAYFLAEQLKKNGELMSISIEQTKLAELKNEEGELVIDGDLYDVESSTVSGNTVKLVLKKDSDETDWSIHYKKIASLLHKHQNGGHTTQGKTTFSILPLYYCTAPTVDLRLLQYRYKIPWPVAACFYPSPVKEMSTPPPRSC